MSDLARRAVTSAWTDLGREKDYPTREAFEDAITSEAERIADLIWDETVRRKSQAIQEFRDANQGNFPPYMQTVQMGNSARTQAEEAILWQELGEELAQETDEEGPDQSWMSSPDRWRTDNDRMPPPTTSIEMLTDEIWPDKPVDFRVMAAFLMQVRYEDQQPMPDSPEDPLRAQFTDLVDDELARRASVQHELRSRSHSS